MPNSPIHVLGLADTTDPAVKKLDELVDISSKVATVVDEVIDTKNYEGNTQLNSRDTNNRNRTNHSGTQLASTISNLVSVVNGLIGDADKADQSSVDLLNTNKADQSSVNSLNTSVLNLQSNKADQTALNSLATLVTNLQTLVSNLQTLVSSDDTTLDDLQEIVDFIKINKNSLESLTISSIAGLQTALDNTISSVTKSDVGLGNVDNTSDLNKPVSTAQATVNTNVQSQIGDINDALDLINGEVV